MLRLTSCKPCITIVNVYRPPDRSLATFFEEFQYVVSTITASTTDRLLICGDFNAPGKDDSSINQGLDDVLETLGLEQHVHSPTRANPDHLLDLIVSDQPSNIREVRVVDSGAVSDHQLIVSSLDIGPSSSSRRPVTFTFRRIKNIDPSDFEARLRRSSLFTSPAEDAESFADQIESVVTAVLDEVAPLETRSRRPPKAITRRRYCSKTTSTKVGTKMAGNEIRQRPAAVSSGLSSCQQVDQHLKAGILP